MVMMMDFIIYNNFICYVMLGTSLRGKRTCLENETSDVIIY